MRTIEGYIEKGRFYPIEHMSEIRGRRRVLVTLLNDSISQRLDNYNANKKNARLAWLNRLELAVDAAQDEDLPEIPRMKEIRPPLILSDFGGS